MKLSLEFGHGQELSQQLNLAPQLLSWLRLLQLPMQGLQTVVQQELQSNPALDLGTDEPAATPASDPCDVPEDMRADGTEWDATAVSELDRKMNYLKELQEDWESSPRAAAGRKSVDEETGNYEFAMDCITARESLQEHLLTQIAGSRLSAEEAVAAELIVGSLDERGFLATPLAELADLAGADLPRMEAALAEVQAFDPPGIAARDLRECLLLQVDPRRDPDNIAKGILTDYFEALANRQLARIAEVMKVTEERVEQALALILTLDPCPGSQFSGDTTAYVAPDVTIRKDDGKYAIELNDEQIPRLHISLSCRRLLDAGNLTAEDLGYIRGCIRKASFLIQGIEQRKETLRRVAQEILRTQREFFDSEEGGLRPLTMAKVAGIVGVHETTVSRALANKYIRTPRGLYPMKYFFCAGYRCNDGSALTTRAVKELVSEAIEAEAQERPLTDLDIVEMLKDKGLKIARRTIAKYREELGIGSSKERTKANRRMRLLQISGLIEAPELETAVATPEAAYA